jgi:hypothetical protein
LIAETICAVISSCVCSREDVDHASELGQADDPVGREIGDMDLADERHHVVLAMGRERDVADEDDVVIALDLLEGAVERLRRILVVAGIELLIRADHAVGRACQPFAGGVVAGPADQGADGFLRFGAAGLGGRGRRLAGPLGGGLHTSVHGLISNAAQQHLARRVCMRFWLEPMAAASHCGDAPVEALYE